MQFAGGSAIEHIKHIYIALVWGIESLDIRITDSNNKSFLI